MNIDDIIRKAGAGDFMEGCRRLSAASEKTPKPIGPDAVRKWPLKGIHDVHWQSVMDLARVSLDEIYQANCEVRTSRKRQHHAAAPERAA